MRQIDISYELFITRIDDNVFISGASLGELTEAELKMVEEIRDVWKAILKVDDITDDTDFFSMGAGSMDVVRSGLTIAIVILLIGIWFA